MNRRYEARLAVARSNSESRRCGFGFVACLIQCAGACTIGFIGTGEAAFVCQSWYSELKTPDWHLGSTYLGQHPTASTFISVNIDGKGGGHWYIIVSELRTCLVRQSGELHLPSRVIPSIRTGTYVPGRTVKTRRVESPPISVTRTDLEFGLREKATVLAQLRTEARHDTVILQILEMRNRQVLDKTPSNG